MIPKVVEVKPLAGYKLWLRFDDGASGIVDFSNQRWGAVFEPLKDQALFAQVKVDPELETVVWPNGADLAPEFLYEAARRETMVQEPAVRAPRHTR